MEAARILDSIPEGLVRDGAYIGGLALANRYLVAIRDDAEVVIPRTVEALLLMNPELALSPLTKVIASRPSAIPIHPIAATAEIVGALLFMLDRLFSSKWHVVCMRHPY